MTPGTPRRRAEEEGQGEVKVMKMIEDDDDDKKDEKKGEKKDE